MFSFRLAGYEINANFKTFLIWFVVWSSIALIFASLFNSFQEQSADLDKVVQNLNPQILKAFNISTTGYLTRVENFLSGQFASIFTLAGSIVGFLTGLSILGSKISNKSIINTLTKKTSRISVYITKLVISSLVLSIFNALIGVTMFSAFYFLSNQTGISKRYFAYLIASCTCLHLACLSFGLALGVMFERSKAQVIGLTLISIGWFLNAISNLAGYPDWAKYLSPFYYVNLELIRDEFMYDKERLAALGAVYLICLVIGVITFRQKSISI